MMYTCSNFCIMKMILIASIESIGMGEIIFVGLVRLGILIVQDCLGVWKDKTGSLESIGAILREVAKKLANA